MKKFIYIFLLTFTISNNSNSEINSLKKEDNCQSFIKKYLNFEKTIYEKIEKFNSIEEDNQEKITQAFLIFNSFSDINFSFSIIKNNCSILNKEDLFFIEEEIKHKKNLTNNIFKFIVINRQNI